MIADPHDAAAPAPAEASTDIGSDQDNGFRFVRGLCWAVGGTAVVIGLVLAWVAW